MLIDIISLGCSKNLVDSERLIGLLTRAGHTVRHNPDHVVGDIVVVNTCGFICDAKEESINMILELCQARGEGRIGELHVMGCLSERYADELPAEIPEVNRWWGKFDWPGLVSYLSDKGGKQSAPTETCYSDPIYVIEQPDRGVTTPRHHAYLKIAEGCNRMCAFCAIPLITGRYKSRPFEEIVGEAGRLAEIGVTELNVIAQDLSAYGEDLYRKNRLAELVDSLANVPGIRRVRLHYAYPAGFPDDLLDVMASNPGVCNYLDIALQHSSDNMLRRMRRHISAADQRALLAKIRERVPGIHIRTTLMVGFPGETDEDFEDLMKFVAEQRFERMGAFAYSEEDDTFAARNYTDDVPPQVKADRLRRVMELQEEISLELQQQKKGRELEVVIDREEEVWYVGRTQWDSPEVDPEVLVRKSVTLAPGDYCTVRITEALPFELLAEPVICKKSDTEDAVR